MGMPENAPHTATITTEIQVMFYDTDCAAVVHNIAYLRFIEEARTKLAEQLGMSLTGMAESGRYPVVVRTEIDYRRPARLGDKLQIRGWLDQVQTARFWCAFEILRPSDGTICVTSRQTLAVIQMPEGKPLRIPPDWNRLAAEATG